MTTSGIRVLERALDVLDYLSGSGRSERVTTIAEHTGLSPATTYRILSALKDRSVVMQGTDSLYRIGPAVLSWSAAYQPKAILGKLFLENVPELARISKETVHLFSFEQNRVYYLNKIDSPQSVIMRSRIGSWGELYCTGGGRAVLGALPEEERRLYLENTPLLPRTPKTETDKERLLKLLAQGNARGWQEEVEENEQGIRCVGAPILDASDYPIGAISVSAPSYRVDEARSQFLGEAVRDTAKQISLAFKRA